jgi:hypothetical protein
MAATKIDKFRVARTVNTASVYTLEPGLSLQAVHPFFICCRFHYRSLWD